MKNTIYFLSIALGFSLLTTACLTYRPKMSEDIPVKKENATTVSSVKKTIENKALVGLWKWVATTGGFAGIRQNPQTAHYTMSIYFKENATYEKYKNGSLTKKGTYSLIQKKVYSQPKEVLLLEGLGTPQIVKFLDGGKKVILSENVNDGFSYTYQKVDK